MYDLPMQGLWHLYCKYMIRISSQTGGLFEFVLNDCAHKKLQKGCKPKNRDKEIIRD